MHQWVDREEDRSWASLINEFQLVEDSERNQRRGTIFLEANMRNRNGLNEEMDDY